MGFKAETDGNMHILISRSFAMQSFLRTSLLSELSLPVLQLSPNFREVILACPPLISQNGEAKRGLVFEKLWK